MIRIERHPDGAIIVICDRCDTDRTLTPRRLHQWIDTHLLGCTKPERRSDKGQVKRPWSAEEDAVLATRTPTEAARILGRTPNACRQRRNLLSRKASA